MARAFSRMIRRFSAAQDGVALVEFALVLPMMLVVFAVMIEGSRMFISYQAAISGVRDAARYLARVAPANICDTGGNLAGYTAQLQTIVGKDRGGKGVLPGDVTLISVTPSHVCDDEGLRGGKVAVATVSARVTIDFPFGGIFTLIGAEQAAVTTTITDRARIFGT